MLQGAMIVWFILVAASAIFVIWDSLVNGVTSWVQRIAWILVTLYTGPVGLFFYLLACRRPFPGGHDRFTAANWKQGLNSEMHCLAGDATGIVIAAAIVPIFKLSNGWDVTIEYFAGLICGLFIFQALMMIGMYGGDYLKAVRKTFFSEIVSMNFVMAGMIPTMVVLEAAWSESRNPLDATFWFRMSMATLVGGFIAYPINLWLVRNHLKHGCMTLPGADGPASGLGHRSPEMASMVHPNLMHDSSDVSSHDLPEMGEHAAGHAMHMASLPIGRSLLWIGFSFFVLLATLLLTNYWVPIRF